MKTQRKIGYDAPNLGQYNELVDHLKQKRVSFKEVSDTDGSVKIPTLNLYGGQAPLEMEPVGTIKIKPEGLYVEISDSKIAAIVDGYLNNALAKKTF